MSKLTIVFMVLAMTGCDRIAQLTDDATANQPALPYEAVAIVSGNIKIAVEAAGTVEPVSTIEVKSKASGEVLELPVETGDLVEAGKLLVRIDQRVLKNTLQQADASLEVSKARLANAESQLKRVTSLYGQKAISTSDWEQSTLEEATAKSEVISREIAVENARIQLGDSDVRAPITGTVIERTVEPGTVISSPMGSVGGGSLLLKMADLSRVQVRMLVDEIDIGKVQPGVAAAVNVAAFPNRPFQGEVIKIEPQAVTQQNVTMFPVLITIDNADGLLKPGMNANVEVLIAQRNNVLTIPNAALRTEGDVFSAGSVLGYSAEDVRAMLEASPRAETPGTAAGGTPPGAEGLSAEDTERLAAIRSKFQSGSRPSEEDIAFMRKMRGASGGSSGGGPGGGMGGQRRGGANPQMGGNYVVFVMKGAKPVAVRVRTGITDMDKSEVVSGLAENDAVLILPSASLIRAQESFQERMQGRMGIPGLNQSSNARPSGGKGG